MIKKQILIGLASFMAISAVAAPIGPEEALNRLDNYGGSRIGPKLIQSSRLIKTYDAANGEPALYLFSDKANKGFMLLSADDCVAPLLGYSESGNFNEAEMAPGFVYWMESLSRQISFLKESEKNAGSFETVSYVLPDWDAIDPLIKSKWDQDAPYNNLCPEVNGIHCYTGCVATSMAQVMRYYRYPEHGVGVISYRPQSLGKNLFMDLSSKIFDYDNMLDTYQAGQYTSEEATAVATLMQAAGYSVQMNYTTSVSGALSAYIPGALISYFQFDPSIAYYDRSDYSYDEWSAMIYEELKNGRPVIYDGTAPFAGGHSFICDGYDGNGYFHINWGWSGMSDGYFLLDALSPSSIGIGGYAGGFIFDQDAVLGIKPYKGGETANEKVLNQYGALFGWLKSQILYLGLKESYPYLGWGYIGNGSGVFDFGAIIENTEGVQELQYVTYPLMRNQNISTGVVVSYIEGMPYNPAIDLTTLEMQDGVKYKVTMATLESSSPEKKWMPVVPYYGYPNYVYVTKNGDNYEVENIPAANYTVSDLEFNSTLYYGCPAKVSLNISNNTEYQLSHPLSIILVDDQDVIRFLGDSFYLTLDPGESINKEYVSNFTLNEGQGVTRSTEFTAYIYDQEAGVYIDNEGVKVTMEPNPGNPTVLAGLQIENADRQGGYYWITDPNNIQVKLNLNVSRGYFAYPVTLHILQKRGNYLYSIISTTFEGVPFLNAGEGTSLSTVMNFANPAPENDYYMQAGYLVNGATTWLPTTQVGLKLDDAGVTGIDMEEDEILFYHDKGNNALTVVAPQGYKAIRGYSLNGMQLDLDITENVNGALVDLSSQSKGIILIQVIDNNGNVKSAKIAL